MILRRLTEHVKTQNWFAVGIDFVIVVVGVFIGLQAQEWSKREGDLRRETQIIGDMLADLDIDRAQYASAMKVGLQRIGAANASLVGAGLPPIDFEYTPPSAGAVDYSVDLEQARKYPESQLDRMWTNIVEGYFPMPSTSTYDVIVGAGDMEIIRNREIVRSFREYYNHIGIVHTQNDKLLSLREDLLRTGASYGLAPYVSIPAADYTRLVAEEPPLSATIRIQATFTIFHHGQIRAADARAAELQERLKLYLEQRQ
jgi:hypothetical protein